MNCLLMHVDYFIISIILTLSLEFTYWHTISSALFKLFPRSAFSVAQKHTGVIEYICNPPPMDIRDVIYHMPNVLDV